MAMGYQFFLFILPNPPRSATDSHYPHAISQLKAEQQTFSIKVGKTKGGGAGEEQKKGHTHTQQQLTGKLIS